MEISIPYLYLFHVDTVNFFRIQYSSKKSFKSEKFRIPKVKAFWLKPV